MQSIIQAARKVIDQTLKTLRKETFYVEQALKHAQRLSKGRFSSPAGQNQQPAATDNVLADLLRIQYRSIQQAFKLISVPSTKT